MMITDVLNVDLLDLVVDSVDDSGLLLLPVLIFRHGRFNLELAGALLEFALLVDGEDLRVLERRLLLRFFLSERGIELRLGETATGSAGGPLGVLLILEG